MRDRDAFVPFDRFVRGAPACAPDGPAPVSPEPPQHPQPGVPPGEDGPGDDALEDALAEVRRFRAALADAFAASIDALLLDVASGVLARELTIAPCDLAAIVQTALRRHADREPVAIRVHPGEVSAIDASIGVSVRADAALRPGDACIDVRCGSIDLSLGARLERILVRRSGAPF